MATIDSSHLSAVRKQIEIGIANYEIQLKSLDGLDATPSSKSTLRAYSQQELGKLREFIEALDSKTNLTDIFNQQTN